MLAVVLLGVAAASEPSEEELLRAEIAEAMEKTGARPGAGAQTVANRVEADEREVFVWLNQFEASESPAVQCDATAKLANLKGEDAVDAVDGLMEHYEDVDERVQVCIRDAVTKLDPSVKFSAGSH